MKRTKQGKLIVVEGTDGSGKGTQAKLLVEYLKKIGEDAVLVSYPRYDTFTGKLVADYLNGNLGTFDSIHPKLASLAFAVDRYDSKAEITHLLNRGATVVCDRYVESNIVYQCAKLPPEERADFRHWLSTVEYDVLGMPFPTITLFLDVPPAISKELVLKKEARNYTDKKEDLHEAQYNFIDTVYTVFNEMAKTELTWRRIDCTKQDGSLRTIRGIANAILEVLDIAPVKPKIFIDLDGPLVNFEKYVAEKGSTGDKIKSIPGAYLEMEPEPGGIEAVLALIGMGYDVWIATKPPTGVTYAYADKAAWVLKYLPTLKRKIIITHDKGLLGNENDYLIDDRPHKANCESFVGSVLHYHKDNWTWPKLLDYLSVRRPNKRGPQ